MKKHNNKIRYFNSSEALLQIIRSQRELISKAASVETSPEVSIHEIRKAVKRLRAIVRPARHFNPDIYSTWNHELKAASKELAPYREISVLEHNLRLLKPLFHHKEVMDIAATHRNEQFAVVLDTGLIHEVSTKIIGIIQAHADIIPKEITVGDIAQELSSGFDKTTKQYQVAVQSNDPEEYHEYRKRCKRVQYQLHILMDSKSRALISLRKQLELLTELLGVHNDMSDLIGYLRQISSQRGLQLNLEPIEKHMLEKRKDVTELSEVVFSTVNQSFHTAIHQSLVRQLTVPIV